MKLNAFVLATLVAVGAIANPHPYEVVDDYAEQEIDVSTMKSQILSYLLEVQAKEQALASEEIMAFGCHWEGTAPFCAANACPRGYREGGRHRCGDGACCITGTKVLCCK